MDIHQLRSGLFELYEPLDNDRQYIVFDAERGNLLVDVPPFSPRAVRLIQGTGRASLVLATNATRAAEAQRFRETLGVRIAAHGDDAAAVAGGADVILGDDELVRPGVRAVRVRADGQAATVAVISRSGDFPLSASYLICGDLDLTSPAARALLAFDISVILSARRPPIWDAGRDVLLQLQRELPKPVRQFSILLPPPWDRAYRGRLEDKMTHFDPIVPRESTATREAAMGSSTLVVSREAQDLVQRAKRPVPAGATAATAGPAAPAAPRTTPRPRSFAEDWNAPGTERPPTTIANPPEDIVAPKGAFRPQPLGERFARAPIEDLVGSPYVDWQWGGISLSPDASEVAFSWNKTGTFEIYSAPLERERIFQLTDAKERSVNPRWAPDGRQIAFLRDRGGDERFDIWVVDRDGEHERNLTNEPGVMHREIAWSPDGQRIAYAANAGGTGFAIHVIDLATATKRALTEGARDDHQPRWSPDGSRIVFWSRREDVRTNSELYLVPASGGAAVRLETRGGSAGESLDASFSSDATRLAFTTNVRGRYEPALATLEGDRVARIEYLTANIHDETEPVWRPDARGVLYLHSEKSETSIRRTFAVSHATHAVADRPGVHASIRIGPDSDLVAFLYSGSREPWDVYVTRERAVQPQRLTRSLPATIDAATLVEPLHVEYPGADGREVPALLYVPHAEAVRGGGAPPAIVYVHGGPTGQHLRWWDRAAQWFANNGYVVLAPNIRGSTGYGREWQEANRGDWGGRDLQDVVKGAEWLAHENIADRRRIGVYGGSYGGFMTLMVLSQAPNVWAAGVSVVGVVSWKTLYDTTRGDLRDYLERELGDPARSADLYRDRSPLTHVAKIQAPLLLLQGANDPRVPRSEAEQMIDALRKGNKTFEEHIYEGEGHGFRTTANMIDALRRTIDWFDRHLQSRA